MIVFTTVARADDIPPQTGLQARVNGRQIAIFNVDGNFFALDGLCPHRGAPLGQGTVVEKTVFCPLHAWQFDLKTGACLDRPDKPVRTFPVRVVDGQVQVRL